MLRVSCHYVDLPLVILCPLSRRQVTEAHPRRIEIVKALPVLCSGFFLGSLPHWAGWMRIWPLLGTVEPESATKTLVCEETSTPWLS